MASHSTLLSCVQGALQQGLFKDPSCLNRCHPLWVLITAKEFCVAVSYLHSMDVVHGDLKSSNVLLKAAAATAVDGRGFVAKVSDLRWRADPCGRRCSSQCWVGSLVHL